MIFALVHLLYRSTSTSRWTLHSWYFATDAISVVSLATTAVCAWWAEFGCRIYRCR